MDFWRAVQELHLERQRLTAVINALESFTERMKKYWAKRKASNKRGRDSAAA
jgi:hypothetical protein